MASRRSCIFCGQRPLTKEHVIGGWAGRFANPDQVAIVLLSDREGQPRERQQWSACPFDRQARVACAACNNGWMSDLEATVSRLLQPDELNGRALSDDEQRSLATWALKTAIVLNAAEPSDRRVMHPHIALQFGRDQTLPAGAEVWITSYDGPDAERPSVAGLGIDLDNRQDNARGWRDLAITTFVVGPFVFQVFLPHPELGIDSLTRSFPPGTHICRIWPPSAAEWRQRPGLSAAGVLGFAEQITNALRQATVSSQPV